MAGGIVKADDTGLFRVGKGRILRTSVNDQVYARFTYVLRANSASGAFFSPRSPPWKTNASITLHRVQSQKWTYLVATAIVIAAILRDLILRLTFHVSAERFIKHTAL